MTDAPKLIWINWTDADRESPPTAVGACTTHRNLDQMIAPIPYVRTAAPEVLTLVEVLRPFADMSAEMFARNWNRPDVATALDGPEGLHRLTFGNFLDLHAALAAWNKLTGDDSD